MSDSSPSGAKKSTRENIAMGLGLAFGAFFVALILLNSNEVEVNWVFGTWSTPLSLLVAISVLGGVLLDRFFILRRNRRQARAVKAAKKA